MGDLPVTACAAWHHYAVRWCRAHYYITAEEVAICFNDPVYLATPRIHEPGDSMCLAAGSDSADSAYRFNPSWRNLGGLGGRRT